MEIAHSAARDAGTDSLDVRRAAQGDRAAFERLYRATAARVHSLARRLAGPEHADELVQEVYLRAWKKLGSFRGDAPFSSWLVRLATNAILNARARRAAVAERERPLELAEHELATVAKSADGELLLRAGELEDAIAALPRGAREVFVLHDVEGQAHAEVAARLGISIGTSKSQLHRARLLLRAALAGRREA
jgi:RNA polymerase sigma-70 factor (ECF subfamily)